MLTILVIFTFTFSTGTNDFTNRDEDTNYDWILDETPRGKGTFIGAVNIVSNGSTPTSD